MKTGEYLVMASKGTNPPRYVHETFKGALVEAKKLQQQLDDPKVLVLEIAAIVSVVEVPVTKKEVRIETNGLPY